MVQTATLTAQKATGKEKVTTYLSRIVSQAMWTLHLLMPKSGLLTDVDARDAEGEF
jgi:hypothetical protein